MDYGSSFMAGGTQAWLKKQTEETSRQAEMSKLREFLEATDESDPVAPIYAKFEDALYAAFRGYLKTERRRSRPTAAEESAESAATATAPKGAPPLQQPTADAIAAQAAT